MSAESGFSAETTRAKLKSGPVVQSRRHPTFSDAVSVLCRALSLLFGMGATNVCYMIIAIVVMGLGGVCHALTSMITLCIFVLVFASWINYSKMMAVHNEFN